MANHLSWLDLWIVPFSPLSCSATSVVFLCVFLSGLHSSGRYDYHFSNTTNSNQHRSTGGLIIWQGSILARIIIPSQNKEFFLGCFFFIIEEAWTAFFSHSSQVLLHRERGGRSGPYPWRVCPFLETPAMPLNCSMQFFCS